MPERRDPRTPRAAVVVTYGDTPLDPITTAALASVDQRVIVRNPRFEGDTGTDRDPAFDPLTLDLNRGYAAAVNAGFAACDQTADCLVLTQDCVISQAALQLLFDVAADSSLGVLAPVLADHDGVITSAGGTCGRWGRVRHLASREPMDSRPVDVDWVDGAVFVVSAPARAAAGAMNEGTFMYGEDVEYCLRVRRAGWRVAVTDRVAVTQRSGAPQRPGAHAYLVVRNNIAVSREIAGLRGVVMASLRGVATAARVLIRPSGAAFSHSLRQALGALWAIPDAWRRVSGPPPRTLQRWGDIQGTRR